MKTSLIWLILVGLALILIGLPSDNDLGWHLAIGRQIVTTGQVPLVDSFSYSAAGTPWPAHSWFLDLVLFLGFRSFGYLGVALIFAVIAATAALVSIKQTTSSSDLTLLSGASLMLVLGLTIFGPRTQLIAWLGIASVLWYVRHTHRSVAYESAWHWLRGSGTLYLLVLFWLWANLHASVVLGVALLGALLFARFLARPSLRLLLVTTGIVTLSGLVTLLNPAGPELWRFGLGIGTSDAVRGFNQEWQSLLSGSFGGNTFWLRAGIVGLSLVVLSATPRSMDWWLVVIGLGLSLYSARFLLLLVPALAGPVALVVSRYAKSALTATAVLVVVLALSQSLSVCGYSQQCWIEERGYHPDLIASLRELPPGSRLFNYYDWGGDLVWLFPEHRVFIDGRMDTFLLGDQPLTQSYNILIHAENTWQSTWEHFDPDVAVLPAQAPLLSKLVELGNTPEFFMDRVVIKITPSPTTDNPVPSQPMP